MSPERTALVLTCEGMGDCLFAQSVIKKIKVGRRPRGVTSAFERL